MRRLFLVVVIALVTGVTVVPALGGAPAASSHRAVAASKKQPKQPCAKAKASKSKKTPKNDRPKKAPKNAAAKKSPKNKKPSKSKKPKSSQCTAKKPAPKKKPKKSTPTKPTATSTPTDTPTSTPTDTPTVTPTATETPTPSPSISTLSVSGQVQQSYLAAFYICGLPSGVTASFSPNPATSRLDTTSPALGTASSTLTVSTPWGTPEGAYSLALHAYYQDRSGHPTQSPPGGGAVVPRGVTLNVDSAGNTSLTSLPLEPAAGFDNCSLIPAGFAPSPTATPSASEINVTGWVSDSHPSMGEREVAYGQILVRNKPVSAVLMHTHWFFPDAVRGCDSVSDSHGIASCAVVIPTESPHQTVRIQVSFEYNGQEYTTYTMFMT